MENTTSNAPIRRRATRKAVLLTLIPMLFAGMAGGFFPLAKYWKNYESEEVTKDKRDSLLLLEKNMNTLLVYLDSIDTKWEKVIVLNKQWETTEAATTKSELETSIKDLEAQIQDKVRVIEQSDLGAIGDKAAYAHQLLLKSQKTIWQLRDIHIAPQSNDNPNQNPGPDPALEKCKDDLQKIRNEAHESAINLNAELDNIQNASSEIRKFLHPKKHQAVQHKIERAVTDIKTLINDLRKL